MTWDITTVMLLQIGIAAVAIAVGQRILQACTLGIAITTVHIQASMFNLIRDEDVVVTIDPLTGLYTINEHRLPEECSSLSTAIPIPRCA